jgi:hypothetical protein
MLLFLLINDSDELSPGSRVKETAVDLGQQQSVSLLEVATGLNHLTSAHQEHTVEIIPVPGSSVTGFLFFYCHR